jgi:glucose-6-phosphate 1-dehydrogenase
MALPTTGLHTIVIFGASGDLTSRKLIPALYELHRKGRLPRGTRIVGSSRTAFSHQAWRDRLAESTAKYLGERFDRRVWDDFATSVSYHAGDVTQAEDVASLGRFLEQIESGVLTTRLYYLSTAPAFYEPAVLNLGRAGMTCEDCAERRVVIEKPFGTDLASAHRLNETVHRVFAESQIYRIDHYLGKETVSNLLVLRFANTIFEPIWNRNYVEHVQITAAEEVAIGHRAGFYETAGVLRDMFQNHLMQLFTLTAMECPARFDADAVRDEKVKVLRCVRPLNRDEIARWTLRGQYDGYRDEPGVSPGSRTATFGAITLHVDNWRWQGVPFYLRSGKAMSCRTTQIVIQFRPPPHMIFGSSATGHHEANRLVIQIQPAEGIQLHFQSKVPDAGMQRQLVDLDFTFRGRFSGELPDAYQRLLLDAMLGDASLFARSDEVEASWRLVDPIQAAWDSDDRPPLDLYEAGNWGPPGAIQWMQRQGRQWFDSCPVLT